MSAKGLRIPDDDSTTKGVVLSYGGSTALTIKPAIGGVSTLNQNEYIQILKSDKKNDLIPVGTNTPVASVWNHKQSDRVEVVGGNSGEGTGPMTITIKLVEK